MKNLLRILVGSMWLVSCQTTRLPASLPAVREYGPLSVNRTQQDEPEPVLTASTEAELVRQQKAASEKPHLLLLSARLTRPEVPAVAPDTVLNRPPTDPGLLRPDPTTTAVNAAGAVTTAVGAGLLLHVFTYTRESELSGWQFIFRSLLGVTLVLIGIPLLFFQGKDGRRRLRREAKHGTIQTESKPTAATSGNNPLRRVGLGLIISGGLLAVISLVVSGIVGALLGIPAALLLIAGLIIYLIGR